MFPPIAKLSDYVDMHLFSTLQYQKGATSLRTINYASHYFISWFLTNFIAEIGDCEKTNETDKSSSKLRMVRRYLMKFKLMISPFCMSIANGSVHGQLLCDFFFKIVILQLLEDKRLSACFKYKFYSGKIVKTHLFKTFLVQPSQFTLRRPPEVAVNLQVVVIMFCNVLVPQVVLCFISFFFLLFFAIVSLPQWHWSF